MFFQCFQFLVVNTVNLSILCLPSIRGYVYIHYLVFLLALFHRRFASYFFQCLAGRLLLPSGKVTSFSLRYLIFLRFSSFQSVSNLSQFVSWPATKSSFSSSRSHKIDGSIPGCWDWRLCETRQCGVLKITF